MKITYYALPSAEVAGKLDNVIALSLPDNWYVSQGYVEVPSGTCSDMLNVHKTHCYENGAFVAMPKRPSEFHDFDYTAKLWVGNTERAWASARSKRALLLSETDWMVAKAMETGNPVPAAWAAYRQALRDITTQPDPTAVQWPVTPN